MSNNPDIYKISFGPTTNSFYLFQNDNNTGSFNFMEENDQNEKELISNSQKKNNENEINFVDMLENYEQKKENAQNHFEFVGESYNNVNDNKIKGNGKNQNKNNSIGVINISIKIQ